MKRFARGLLVLSIGLLFLAGAGSAWAHSFTYSTSISCTGPSCETNIQHDDEDTGDGYKGWATFTLTNTGSIAWGDFHFKITQVSDPIDDVAFVVDSPYQPTISPNTFDDPGWAFDNDVVGAELDLFFYGDPVGVGDTVTISVYTDNTVNTADIFGMCFYPTPVPEPTTIVLLTAGLGGLAMIGRRRRS
jgi:hypothetical protein